MKMRVLTTKLGVEIKNEMRVFLESLNFKIEMRVSQKSDQLLTLFPIYIYAQTMSFKHGFKIKLFNYNCTVILSPN